MASTSNLSGAMTSTQDKGRKQALQQKLKYFGLRNLIGTPKEEIVEFTPLNGIERVMKSDLKSIESAFDEDVLLKELYRITEKEIGNANESDNRGNISKGAVRGAEYIPIDESKLIKLIAETKGLGNPETLLFRSFAIRGAMVLKSRMIEEFVDDALAWHASNANNNKNNGNNDNNENDSNEAKTDVNDGCKVIALTHFPDVSCRVFVLEDKDGKLASKEDYQQMLKILYAFGKEIESQMKKYVDCTKAYHNSECELTGAEYASKKKEELLNEEIQMKNAAEVEVTDDSGKLPPPKKKKRMEGNRSMSTANDRVIEESGVYCVAEWKEEHEAAKKKVNEAKAKVSKSKEVMQSLEKEFVNLNLNEKVYRFMQIEMANMPSKDRLLMLCAYDYHVSNYDKDEIAVLLSNFSPLDKENKLGSRLESLLNEKDKLPNVQKSINFSNSGQNNNDMNASMSGTINNSNINLNKTTTTTTTTSTNVNNDSSVKMTNIECNDESVNVIGGSQSQSIRMGSASGATFGGFQFGTSSTVSLQDAKDKNENEKEGQPNSQALCFQLSQMVQLLHQPMQVTDQPKAGARDEDSSKTGAHADNPNANKTKPIK